MREQQARVDHPANVLLLRRLGIDTYQEPVIYMAADCPVCRSEGWAAQARVLVTLGDRSVIATLNVVTDESNKISLSADLASAVRAVCALHSRMADSAGVQR